MMGRVLIFPAFLLSALLAVYGGGCQMVSSQCKIDDDTLLRGNWHQYGTQLLVQRGHDPHLASKAIHSTEPTAEATREVLED